MQNETKTRIEASVSSPFQFGWKGTVPRLLPDVANSEAGQFGAVSDNSSETAFLETMRAAAR